MASATSFPANLHIRPATESDIPSLTANFYTSFGHAPFMAYLFPKSPYFDKWWNEVFALGLQNPTDRTFVATDSNAGDKVVAFSRWMVPQADGNLERKWPEVGGEAWTDMEVAEAFFGGMGGHHEKIMVKRPHYFLELLGTDKAYQRQGIAGALIRWGTDQADKEGLETYLDASEEGREYYIRRHDFVLKGEIPIPRRPDSYGEFQCVSVLRQPKKSEGNGHVR
ncbi:hypothetical protein B0A48_16978 [Cryoendolithus antarcticus]|uniref:N-acetyltransferase domain-containing protein n=1 Tax=Cryoendolithus antarcticus TaxID=1507870 RepID=A0A1V8SCU5_9PEZI|nr:hypothetical protein B0A48_16978 [Cryoendolithus antarcticus]